MDQRNGKTADKVFSWSIILMFLILNLPGYSQGRDDIVIGTRTTMHSKILNKEIDLSLHVPDSHDKANNRYPVLYTFHTHFEMVSGVVKNLYDWNLIPEIIVIGVDSYEYGYLTPTPVEKNPNWGEADRFLEFFENELFPFIDSTYRTHPYRMVYSGALGGVFTIYAVLARPDVFNAGLAPVPWIIYDNEKQYMIKHTESFLDKNDYQNFLYITMDNEYELVQDLKTLVDVLDKFPEPGLEWEYHFWPEEDHYSSGPRALHSGLRSLFRGWNTIPVHIAHQGLAPIKRHEQSLKKKFGYDIGLSMNALWWAAQGHLKSKQYDEAIAIYQYRVEKRPDDSFARVDLGIAYERNDQLDLAKRSYQKAYDIENSSAKTQPRYLKRIRNFLDNIDRKLGKNQNDGT